MISFLVLAFLWILMRSPNLPISKRKHINISVRKMPESPLFLFPSIYWLPKHDVNLEIEGTSIGFCFLRWVTQINFRQVAWRKRSAEVDLTRANRIASKIQEAFGQSPDAIAIVRAFQNQRWLLEVAERGLEDAPYSLRLIRDAAKEESVKKDQPPRTPPPIGNVRQPSVRAPMIDIQVEGLE